MITVSSADEMFNLGQKLTTHLKRGDLILVNGPLGAGKTLLAQGIASALGIHDVTSPTFVISRVHKGALQFVHVDAYRLLDIQNSSLYVADLDLDIENSVTVIEWGGAEFAQLSENRLEITIDRSDEIRNVEINYIGERWAGFSL